MFAQETFGQAIGQTASPSGQVTASPSADMSADAAAELRAALDYLKANHMNRDKVDWPAVEVSAFQIARNARTPAQTYQAILYVIAMLGEKHTTLIFAEREKALHSQQPSASTYAAYYSVPPSGTVLDKNIGLLKITPYMGTPERDRAYVTAVRDVLQKFQAQGVCQIIVDLRGNGGGNMWPMVNGIASLLVTSPYGYFLSAGKPKDPWILRNNWMGLESEGIAPVDIKLAASRGSIPIAVLLDRHAGSAGEFTAIALEGRPHTRFFGEPTAGYVTVNIGTNLPDGALLTASTGWSEDRLHRPYRVAVVPDEETSPGQATPDAAEHWLKTQRCSRKN